jgi:hypothetical protein
MSNVSDPNMVALKHFLQMAIPIAQHQLETGEIDPPTREELDQLAADIGSETDVIMRNDKRKDMGKIVGRMAKAIAYATLQDEAKQNRIDKWLDSLDDPKLER